MEWPDESGIGVELNKMSPITLVAFGLGWYLSDTLTRDEKQSWQRKSDDEFNRSVERQEASNRMSRNGRKIKKSAYDGFQQLTLTHWLESAAGAPHLRRLIKKANVLANCDPYRKDYSVESTTTGQPQGQSKYPRE